MKFEFDLYEVEVKARSIGKDFNKSDTLSAMNFLALACLDASKKYEGGSLELIGKGYEKAGRKIYEQLKEYGILETLLGDDEGKEE